MNQTQSVQEALAAVQKALGSRSMEDPLFKAQGITTSNGLVWYDLEPSIKNYAPVLTPLRNYIPRVAGDGGTATHWKAVTKFNTQKIIPGVSEGNRNAFNSTQTKSYTASYATIGHDDFVSFEAQNASRNLNPQSVALAVRDLLWNTMVDEDTFILGNNGTVALGQVTGVTLSDNSAAGGSIPQTSTVKVYVVPLTHSGLVLGPTGTSGGLCVTGDTLRLRDTRTNADGSTDTEQGFNGQVSSVATITTATDGNNAHTVSVSWTPVVGAFGYAILWGPTIDAGSLLGAVVTINSYIITTTVGAGTTAANNTGIGTDYSKEVITNQDGLLSIIAGAGPEDGASASGSYTSTFATGTPGTGTKLTSDSAGGITEISAAFKSFWKNYRLSPDAIWVSSQQLLDITQLVIAGGGTPLYRFQVDGQNIKDNGMIGGTRVIGSLLNPFGMAPDAGMGGKEIPVLLHPTMPDGTILFTTKRLPYKVPNVTNPVQIKTRQDYYQIEYPLVTRKYQFGVYSEQVTQVMFPPAFGYMTNIAPVNASN